MKYCCEKFEEEAGREQAFEPDQDGETWNINGCCGGGCFVVTEMRFCPYCGSKMESPHGAEPIIPADRLHLNSLVRH